MTGNTLSNDRSIAIAVLAIGGQGGGVVTDWLVALAESQGWRAQSTSVPGVAQRTGATVYYVEMIKQGPRDAILSLMPTPGDVDLVVAAEWMEAGRAMQRGLVSPDRTTFIASTHRNLSIAEKIVPADGVRDPASVEVAAKACAKIFMSADFAEIASANGSVISASLFGAIAASKRLPFARDAFENAIRAGGIGVDPSLRAFDAGFRAIEAVAGSEPPILSVSPADRPAMTPELVGGSDDENRKYKALLKRLETAFNDVDSPMPGHGLNRVVDFHDADYGAQYLDRLAHIKALDNDASRRLTITLSKYLANAMAYQDVIRVADLKTRASRFNRIRDEIKASEDNVVKLTEFMHPRMEEICGLLPVGLGQRAEKSRIFGRLIKLVTKGRRVRTDSLSGFLLLYTVAGLKRWRLKSLRHHIEMQHIDDWLGEVEKLAERHYELAIELVKCQRLIKGYSDTHNRGLSRFARVTHEISQLAKHEREGPLAVQKARTLIDAALGDADGDALTQAIDNIGTATAQPLWNG